MLQLANHTPFNAQFALLPDANGIDTLYVVVRGSFNLCQPLTLCDEQPAPAMADVYWGEPGQSSLKYPGEFHPGKAGTDIIMLGHACAPDKKWVYYLDASLQVGNLSKAVRVFGPRVWQSGQPSQPEAFVSQQIWYEDAFGGQEWQAGQVVAAEERNPVGRGFLGRQSPSLFDGQPVPCIEDIAQPIRQLGDRPPPAGFGAIAPHWLPRRALAGTYDEHWQQHRAPFLPEDYSPRFMNLAHPDLICDGFLQGGEPISITGMHPSGPLQCQLPQLALFAEIDMAGRTHTQPCQLETLLLEPNQLQMSLTWKAALACDKNALKIRQIRVKLAR